MTTIQHTNTSSIRFQGKSFLTDPDFAKFAKGAAGTVVTTTILKAIGRPAFIYADKTAEPEARKYSAAKEFLYQVLCLGIALSVIPFFSRGGYKLAGMFVKDKGNKVKELVEKLQAKKEICIVNKKTGKTDILRGYKLFLNKFDEEDKHSEAMQVLKGGAELGSLAGSVIGLTIIAPLISHKILHPVMKAIGIEKKEKPQANPVPNSQPIAPDSKAVDIKA